MSGNLAVRGLTGKEKPSIASLRVWLRRQELFILVLLLLVGAFLSLRTGVFLTAANLSNIALYFSWIAIAAIGESLVILIGGIDLSVGAGMALAGLVSALCLQRGLPISVSILAGLFTGGLLGWSNGSLVGRIRLPAFIATLGTMSIARGITFGLTGGWPVRNLPKSFLFLGQQYLALGPLHIAVAAIIVLGIAVFVLLFLQNTVVGGYIQTLGVSERALRFAGVAPVPLKIMVYTVSGVLAAVGGILMTSNLGVAASTAAAGYELDIIAAAIIGGANLSGGKGSILGVLLGAAFLQVLRNGLVLLGFPVFWQPVAIGAMILAVLTVNYFRRTRSQL